MSLFKDISKMCIIIKMFYKLLLCMGTATLCLTNDCPRDLTLLMLLGITKRFLHFFSLTSILQHFCATGYIKLLSNVYRILLL